MSRIKIRDIGYRRDLFHIVAVFSASARTISPIDRERNHPHVIIYSYFRSTMTILLGSPATRIKVFQQLAGGLIVCSIPVAVWWKSAADNRAIILEQQRTKVRVPNIQDSDDLLVERMQAGDVLLFDRRCEKCAAGPWAALACLAGRSLLCDERATRSVDQGRFDHVGKAMRIQYINRISNTLYSILLVAPIYLFTHPLYSLSFFFFFRYNCSWVYQNKT
jgi:hypothetical protein